MKNFIENHKKGIGIFFIFIAVIFMALYFLITAHKKAQIPSETLRTPEEIQKLESDTGNDTIPDRLLYNHNRKSQRLRTNEKENQK